VRTPRCRRPQLVKLSLVGSVGATRNDSANAAPGSVPPSTPHPDAGPEDEVDAERLISQLDAAISNDLRDHIRQTLEMLTPREEQVVRMRFGIGEAHDHPPEEIARQLALSRQRIFSIQADALRKLRRPRRQLKPVNRP